MRVGAITGMNITDWQETLVRQVVSKKPPGYIMPARFDMKIIDKTVKVMATLVGTSNSDLNSQLNKLRQYEASKQIVWVDASDQYADTLALGKINNLQTQLKGGEPLTAPVQFDLETTPPWGCSNVSVNNQSGVFFRDLTGILLDSIIDPIINNCNYTIDNVGKSITWEFIIDNQNLYNSILQITTCDATTGFSTDTGTGTSFVVDSVILKQGTGSVKMTGTSDSSGRMGATYTSTSTNINGYDFFCLWVRSNFGGAATGNISVFVGTSASNSYNQTYFSLNANTWYRLVVPWRAIFVTGSPNASSVTFWTVRSTGATTAATNLWVDDFEIDTGLWSKMEFMIPDNLKITTNSTFQTSSYNAGYVQLINENNLATNNAHTALYALDGTLLAQDSGSPAYVAGIGNGATFFRPANFNKSAVIDLGNDSSFTYSLAYGPLNRFALSLKMPPATSDSLSGNIPGNDITGIQAINKVRCKIQVFYTDEIFGMMGF